MDQFEISEMKFTLLVCWLADRVEEYDARFRQMEIV